MQCAFGIGDANIAQRLGLAPSLAHNTVMGFHHGVGNGGLPLQGTDSKNSQPPLIGNVAQIVGEIALPLPTKAGDPMGWDAIKGGSC